MLLFLLRWTNITTFQDVSVELILKREAIKGV